MRETPNSRKSSETYPKGADGLPGPKATQLMLSGPCLHTAGNFHSCDPANTHWEGGTVSWVTESPRGKGLARRPTARGPGLNLGPPLSSILFPPPFPAPSLHFRLRPSEAPMPGGNGEGHRSS